MELKIKRLPLDAFQQIIGALVLKYCDDGETILTIEEIVNVEGVAMYFEEGKFKIKSIGKNMEVIKLGKGKILFNEKEFECEDMKLKIKKAETDTIILCEVTNQFPIKNSDCECDVCKIYKEFLKNNINFYDRKEELSYEKNIVFGCEDSKLILEKNKNLFGYPIIFKDSIIKNEEGGMPILCEVTKQFPIKDSNCECDGCKVYKALSKK